MFLSIDHHRFSALPALRRSMFACRAGQFVERHGWPLQLNTDGLEIDAYDDANATYCVVASGSRHLASVRLRPAAANSMTEDHFPDLWRDDLRAAVEITRFCCALDLAPEERLTAVADLLLGLCRHCQTSGITGIFGIVFRPVARVIRQAGWTATTLGESRRGRDTLVLAQWTPGDLVAWDIQEKRELREEARARRLSAAAVDALAA